MKEIPEILSKNLDKFVFDIRKLHSDANYLYHELVRYQEDWDGTCLDDSALDSIDRIKTTLDKWLST